MNLFAILQMAVFCIVCIQNHNKNDSYLLRYYLTKSIASGYNKQTA